MKLYVHKNGMKFSNDLQHDDDKWTFFFVERLLAPL